MRRVLEDWAAGNGLVAVGADADEVDGGLEEGLQALDVGAGIVPVRALALSLRECQGPQI